MAENFPSLLKKKKKNYRSQNPLNLKKDRDLHTDIFCQTVERKEKMLEAARQNSASHSCSHQTIQLTGDFSSETMEVRREIAYSKC